MKEQSSWNRRVPKQEHAHLCPCQSLVCCLASVKLLRLLFSFYQFLLGHKTVSFIMAAHIPVVPVLFSQPPSQSK